MNGPVLIGRFDPGKCHCGCGGTTKIATRTRSEDGIRKGAPLRYIKGHSGSPSRQDESGRFWAFVDAGEPGDCWLWIGGRNAAGYGKFWLDGHTVGAHRFSLERKLGRRLDRDELSRHSCDNPPCVNPAHLSPGTGKDNSADAIERGRHAALERNGMAKLTVADAAELRALRASGATYEELQHRYGVSSACVYNVLFERSWRIA